MAALLGLHLLQLLLKGNDFLRTFIRIGNQLLQVFVRIFQRFLADGSLVQHDACQVGCLSVQLLYDSHHLLVDGVKLLPAVGVGSFKGGFHLHLQVACSAVEFIESGIRQVVQYVVILPYRVFYFLDGMVGRFQE